jgi:hypothetical protein
MDLPIYSCKVCDYETTRRFNYKKHLETISHIKRKNEKSNDSDSDDSLADCCKKYYCEKCNFIANKKSNFAIHLGTQKHIQMENKAEVKFKCKDCDEEFKDQIQLYKHCVECIETKTNSFGNNNNLVLFLMNENKELKQLLLEQNKETTKLFLENQQNIIETMSNGIKVSGSFNNNNNTTNNFNLQVFLNETCKNAMNFSDFIKGIQTDLNDVEYVGKNGYVNGISNIVIRNLCNMKVEERPLHCTDQRRETIYIKDNDVWEKEDVNNVNNKMIQLVRDVSVMNAKNVHIWRDKYPQCLTAYSDKTDQYNYIVHEALGGDTKYTTKQKEEKIISKILKCVVVDKK